MSAAKVKRKLRPFGEALSDSRVVDEVACKAHPSCS